MIIGIDGGINVGKSSVAASLVKNHGYTELSLAYHLKQMCMYVFNLSYAQVWSQEGKAKEVPNPMKPNHRHAIRMMNYIYGTLDWPDDDWARKACLLDSITKACPVFKTPRQVLQIVGTEFIRKAFDEEFWIKITMDYILRKKLDRVVISDARFHNEKTILRENGAKIIFVKCLGTMTGLESPQPQEVHQSEKEKWSDSEYDYRILNNKASGLDMLDLNVNCMVEYFNCYGSIGNKETNENYDQL